MPQPKRRASSSKRSSSSQGSSSSRRTSSARKTSSSRGAGSSASRSRSTARKSTGASKARRRTSPAAEQEFSGKTVAAFRDALAGGVLTPLNLILLSRERIQEAVDDAVSRGRMTRGDATELVQGLLRTGYKQTNDVLADLEQLLGRSREGLTGTVTRARKHDAVDRVVRGADRARRVAGVGPTFPILGYDDLTAAQITARLGELSPAELRKVRDYERRHGNRKSVLVEIERKLG
jgi:polyhydroxyalkanoate synthesis regulator phasin